MSMWEDKFQEYKNGEHDLRIEELKIKIEKRESKSEEVKEYNKMQRVKESYKQIEKVMEKKNDLTAEMKKIDDELKIRASLKTKGRRLERLDEKLQKLNKSRDELNNKLKDSNLSKEEKAKLISERDEINIKINENSKEYSDITLELQKVTGDRELSNSSKEELETEKLKIATKISMCDHVGENLLNGLSWDSIEKRMGNLKYTSKDGKLKEVIDKKRNIEQKESSIDEDALKARRAKIVSDFKLDKAEVEKALMPEKSEFDKKHPKFAKIKNWFKKILKTGKDKSEKRFLRENDAIEENKPQQEEHKMEKNEDNVLDKKEVSNFLAELKYKEPEEKRKEVEKQLADFRAKNRENEAKKFGKDYADKSDYRSEGR